jgi:hypothetical protein
LGEWEAFERSYGPILVHERIDLMGALIASVMTGNPIEDLLPRWGQQEPEVPVSFLEGLASRIGKEVQRT